MADANIRKLGSSVESMACELTSAELEKYGGDLARAVQDIIKEKARQTEIKTGLKKTLEALDSRCTELSSWVNSKEEFRNVTLDRILNLDADEYQEIRRDTGEIHFKRPMREDERQTAMTFTDEETTPLDITPEIRAEIRAMSPQLIGLARELIGRQGEPDDVVSETYAADILNEEEPNMEHARDGLVALAALGIVKASDNKKGEWIICMTLQELDAILMSDEEPAEPDAEAKSKKKSK